MNRHGNRKGREWRERTEVRERERERKRERVEFCR